MMWHGTEACLLRENPSWWRVSYPIQKRPNTVRDDYIKAAQKVIPDPNILINVVSRRVKQLKYGQKPLVESLERLSPEDIALREVIDGKITYELFDTDEAEEK